MKRIIVCCDGTWYAADKGENCLPSNVARMSRVISKTDVRGGKHVPQIVLYQSGVGTGSLGWVDKRWQGAFGGSLNENMCEIYNFIATNWEEGDEIFLFGFSRGAYTTRAVSGLICDAGLLKARHMDSFFEMYSAYKNRHNKNDTTWPLWQEKHTTERHPDVKIKAVGVWDTVGSLGLPDTYWSKHLFGDPGYFHNTRLHPKIEHAFHALALDERRGTFSPTLWYLPKSSPAETVLEQCWFPGYHSDVGGGTTEGTKDEAQIDEIAFAWMVDRLQYHNLLDFTTENVFKYILPGSVESEPIEWASGTLTDSYSMGYYFAGGSKTRTPMQTLLKDAAGKEIKDVTTEETIHPSVWHRMHSMEKSPKPYKPEALKGWKRRNADKEGAEVVWTNGDMVLPEYVVPKLSKHDSTTGFGSVERLLMPQKLQKELDIMSGVCACDKK